ncbi:MAG: endonuclease/exonuclease/phosphatase family protein [Pseudomonadota bacterium]
MRAMLLTWVLALSACGLGAPAPFPKDGVGVEDVGAAPELPEAPDVTREDTTPPTGISATITFDGRFDDWAGVSVAVSDVPGDGGPSGIDLTALRVADDGARLYLDLDVGTEIELDWGNGLSLFLRCEEGEREIRWDPGLRSGHLVEGTQKMELEYGDLGFVAAPVTTASRFEITLALDALAVLLGDCARDAVRLRFEDRSVAGDTLPDAGWLSCPLSGEEIPPPALPALARAPGTLRVVTWNVLWSGIVDPGLTPSFRRIIQALDPDVIALQEILEHGEVHTLLLEWFPGEWWEYAGYGNMVTFSRFPRMWDWPGSYQPLDSRVSVAAFETPQAGMFVMFNAHLSFGDQDEERQQEADSFIAYLRDLQTPGGLVDMPGGTPFALVGDLNLVGDRAQLDTLLTGAIDDTATYGESHPPDWDGSALEDRFALQAGRRDATTWRAEGGGFWPGKLDYVILPDSVVSVANEFVLDTAILPADLLAAYGMEATDTEVSDHLPVVVDLVLLPVPGSD